MDIGITMVVALFFMSFGCGFIYSSVGIAYGSILSPALITAGFNPLLVVPSVLLSQSLGGFSASVFHHKYKNVNFQLRSPDSMVVYIITGAGVIATIVAVAVAINISKLALETYIGLLVSALGIILLSKIRFRFSWKKISAVGVVSSFNKGLSGSGFAPIVTSSQIAVGRDARRAIGSTVLAGVPICAIGFLTYTLARGVPDLALILPLCAGAVAAAPIGAFMTGRFPSANLGRGLGALVLLLGIWMLVKVWVL